MKTYNTNAAQSVTGALSRKKMTIAANAKMFRQLISGIYSDKAYAIARELFGNYWDAHVLAGNTDKPCEVHVPTVLEPFYALRDFGVSMTHELVENTYSSLGTSTKDDPDSEISDTLVGKFGLGSKSPFSYVDSFQLTCYLDGEARYYDCFLGEDGPETALLHAEATTEPNGVLVQFPVDPNDIADFERALRRAWEALDVDPVFTGKQLTKIQRTIIRAGTNWRLQNGTQSGRAEARQGTVLYPLNAEAIINIPDELKPLCSAPFVFDFPIGQLDITTSREALSYDQQTSANIIAALQAALDEIVTDFHAKLKGAKTYAEFCETWLKLKSTGNHTIDGLLSEHKVTFKGREPKGEVVFSFRPARYCNGMEERDGQLFPKVAFGRRLGGFDAMRISSYDWSRSGVNGFRKNKGTTKDNREINVSYGTKLLVVVEDESQKRRMSNIRMRDLRDSFESTENTQVLWLRHWGLKPEQIAYALKRLYFVLGQKPFEVRNLLDVPYVAPARFYAGETIKRDDYKIIEPGGAINSPYVDLTGKVFYAPLFKNELAITGFSGSARDLHNALQILVPNQPYTLIGIPATKRHLVSKNSDWVDAHAFIKAKIESKFNPGLFAIKRAIQVVPSGARTLEQTEKLRDLFGKKRWELITQGRSIGRLLELYERTTQVRDDLLARADRVHDLIGTFVGRDRYHELLQQADKIAQERKEEITALIKRTAWDYPILDMLEFHRLAIIDKDHFLNTMSEIISAPRDSILDIAQAA